MSLISARGVSKYFGGLGAVDGVDLDIEPGEIHAIIGPNGAGKTTFVSLLCGRLGVTTGSIHFDGQDITHVPAWRRVRLGIAYTFQITSIYPRLSVRENVAIAAHGPGRDGGGKVESILSRVSLDGRADEIAGNLAYGHQRLLEVAMGLALEPQLLILDEPTQGLSDSEIAQFCDLVREIGRDATVLLIEHNMQVVMSLAARVTVFDRGRVLAHGTPAEIRADSAVQTAYLGGGAGT
jgi:branched-chain amino acid transport system ATP-binding protein